MKNDKKITIFDTTLRDGDQCPGASMNVEEKVEIAGILEKLNVDIIEAGFAIASPGDFESVKAVAEAVRIRARPIYMSTLTSIFGMMPLMLVPGVGSQIYRGLATVIIGGMFVSAVFTLILMPSILRLPPVSMTWLSARRSKSTDIPGATVDA